MLYVIHYAGDSIDGGWEWYHVFPKKKTAMRKAAEHVEGTDKKIVYLRYDSDMYMNGLHEHDSRTCVVVTQLPSIYSGA